MLQTTWQYFKLTTWYFVGIRSCKGKKQTIFGKNSKLEGCPKGKVEANSWISSPEFNQSKQLSETNFGINVVWITY